MPRGIITGLDELDPTINMQETGKVQRESGETYRIFEPETKSSVPKQLEDRTAYETFLKEKYGDPWQDASNMASEIDETTRANEKELFSHVFGDSFRYEDRKQLDSKAASHWKNSLLQYRKDVENELTQDIEGRKEMLAEQLGAFDKHNRDQKLKTPKGVSKSDILKVLKAVEEINERGGEPTPNEMLTLQVLTEDLPFEAKEMILQEGKKRSLVGIDMLYPDIPKKSELSLVEKEDDSPDQDAVPAAGTGSTEDRISKYLKDNGYAVTPKNIQTAIANNPGF